jgi:hypothetical protein
VAFFRDRTALSDLGVMIPLPVGKINCGSNASACKDLPAARMAIPTSVADLTFLSALPRVIS